MIEQKNNKFNMEGSDTDKSDNYVYRVISQDTPRAYLSINTSYPEIDSLIKTYLKQYVTYESNINNAELIISVGKFTNEFKEMNPETVKSGLLGTDKNGWGFIDEFNTVIGGGRYITAFGKRVNKIYSGLVGRTKFNNKPLILAYGIGVDGDIAAVKKLISARSFYFGRLWNVNFEFPPLLIDQYDTLALGVNNLLQKNIPKNSTGYLSTVNKILFNNIYDVAIRTVKTLPNTSYAQNTTLRLKNVNSDYSQDFKDAINEYDRPVVFCGGIFNDLEFWEKSKYDFFGFQHVGLAKEMANDGRDVWEIEMNSGPTTDECPNCPNYNYSDMVQYYWPVLIAGIQNYSGKSNLDYVGFSQGCRVALDSLEIFENGQNNVGYSFSYDNGQYESVNLKTNPINIFVGLGCSGTFKGYSFFQDFFGKYGGNILEEAQVDELGHISNVWLGKELMKRCQLSDQPYCFIVSNSLINQEHEKNISKNSAEYYLNSIHDNNTKQPGTNVEFSKVMIIYGELNNPWYGFAVPSEKKPQDGLATANDSIEIFNGINASGELTKLNLQHSEFSQDSGTRKRIKEFIG